MGSKRKLAAILFTDIVGYSAQVSADETRSLKERQRVERLIKDCSASHDGRVIKTIGDAVMLEFGSAVDAVSCAISIQERMQPLNDEAVSTTPIQVRIGVHVGDVVEEDNDLFGNAVNIAQRIQDMAAPGGICISREVYVQIRPILKLRCDVVSTPGKKPMPESVEVLTVTNDILAVASEPKADSLLGSAWMIRLVSIPLFLAGWMIAMLLWNLGGLGAASGGVLFGAGLIAICRKLTEHIPGLRENSAYRRKTIGAKIVRLAPLLLLFAADMCFINALYVNLLDHSPIGGWGTQFAPWTYAEDHKGEEYRVLNRLRAFQSHPPQVSIDVLRYPEDSSEQMTVAADAICAILAILFFLPGAAGALCVGYNKDH